MVEWLLIEKLKICKYFIFKLSLNNLWKCYYGLPFENQTVIVVSLINIRLKSIKMYTILEERGSNMLKKCQ